MPKKTAEELIASVSKIVGEETSEDVIELMEDIKDSIIPDPYEEKYIELLGKYRARFESAEDVEQISETPVESEEVKETITDITIEDLIEEV